MANFDELSRERLENKGCYRVIGRQGDLEILARRNPDHPESIDYVLCSENEVVTSVSSIRISLLTALSSSIDKL